MNVSRSSGVFLGLSAPERPNVKALFAVGDWEALAKCLQRTPAPNTALSPLTAPLWPCLLQRTKSKTSFPKPYLGCLLPPPPWSLGYFRKLKRKKKNTPRELILGFTSRGTMGGWGWQIFLYRRTCVPFEKS